MSQITESAEKSTEFPSNENDTKSSSQIYVAQNKLSSPLTGTARVECADEKYEQSDMSQLNHPISTLDVNAATKIVSVVPKDRQQLVKWNGWGYKDSRFHVKERNIYFSGNRYPIGELCLPNFTEWVTKVFNIEIDDCRQAQPMPVNYPKPIMNDAFFDEFKMLEISHTSEGMDRLFRAHGQTLRDIFTLREGTFERIPDLVVWPTSHEDVVKIVELADKYNVAVIPFGGGTSVSGAITCPTNEYRTIVSLDTSQMNKLLWLDRDNLTACFESGIVGQDMERALRAIGLTVGHEPDSYEFSTLGGWVATRASGMKKNVYGNIEDIVVQVSMVTCKGVLERNAVVPRMSSGPDFNHLILGSEGTLGVITKVTVKVRPLPPVKRFGSLVFPDFSSGVRCVREIAKRRCQPASIRLIDNTQYKFGLTLKGPDTWLDTVKNSIKNVYLTKIKRFDPDEMVVATLSFEGEELQVRQQEKLIAELATKFGGFSAGGANGERGYVLTFVIAYIRDIGLEYNIVCESFETSCSWNRCEDLCRNVKTRVSKECAKANINYYMISCRVTQSYDAGCAVYFYFGFQHIGIADPVGTFEHIETVARDEILACGGSISHHHGVGKLRSQWYPKSVSTVGVGLLKSAKMELDPKNVFAAGNLLPDNLQLAKL